MRETNNVVSLRTVNVAQRITTTSLEWTTVFLQIPSDHSRLCAKIKTYYSEQLHSYNNTLLKLYRHYKTNGWNRLTQTSFHHTLYSTHGTHCLFTVKIFLTQLSSLKESSSSSSLLSSKYFFETMFVSGIINAILLLVVGTSGN